MTKASPDCPSSIPSILKKPTIGRLSAGHTSNPLSILKKPTILGYVPPDHTLSTLSIPKKPSQGHVPPAGHKKRKASRQGGRSPARAQLLELPCIEELVVTRLNSDDVHVVEEALRDLVSLTVADRPENEVHLDQAFAFGGILIGYTLLQKFQDQEGIVAYTLAFLHNLSEERLKSRNMLELLGMLARTVGAIERFQNNHLLRLSAMGLIGNMAAASDVSLQFLASGSVKWMVQSLYWEHAEDVVLNACIALRNIMPPRSTLRGSVVKATICIERGFSALGVAKESFRGNTQIEELTSSCIQELLSQPE